MDIVYFRLELLAFSALTKHLFLFSYFSIDKFSNIAYHCIMYDSHIVFKKNILKLLKFWGVRKTAISKLSGHSATWICDITSPIRYQHKIGSYLIDHICELLNVPPWVMIDPLFDESAYKLPPWFKEAKKWTRRKSKN